MPLSYSSVEWTPTKPPLNLFEELKRRNVFRVAVAYTIVGWVLVQVANTFFPALRLPDWTITLVAGLVILGFPVALLLAWAYQITPSGIKPTAEVQTRQGPFRASEQRLNYAILGLVALAVALIIVDRYVLGAGFGREAFPGYSGFDSRPVVAGSVLLSPTATLASGAAAIGFDNLLIAISPDSSWLVYAGLGQSGSLLYRRRLDQLAPPEPIAGTEGAIHAFFSPDGRSVGFLTDDRLKRVTLEGNNVQTIATMRNPVRGFWIEDEWIYVADEQGFDLVRVRATGGELETVIDRSSARISDVLLGGRKALAAQIGDSVSEDYADIVLVDLKSGELHPLGLSGFDARMAPSGHLLFARNGNVLAARFDEGSGTVEGQAALVLQEAAVDSLFGQAQVAWSPSGTLAYVPGKDRGIGLVVSVDRQNVEHPLPIAPQKFSVLDLSDDDRELAVHIADVKDYVWIYDVARQEGRKLAGSEGFGSPKFSPSGMLAFSSVDAAPGTRLMRASTDGSVLSHVNDIPDAIGMVSDWSPEGDLLAISDWANGGIGLMRGDGRDEVRWLSRHRGDWGAVFSPDGRWIAYSSNQTGRYEIWIRSAGDGNPRRQLSVNGGLEPVWCPCGKVFFRRGNQFWASEVRMDDGLSFGPEELHFAVSDFLDTPGRSYDVSSDGQTLYTVKRAEPSLGDRIHLLANWLDNLDRSLTSPK